MNVSRVFLTPAIKITTRINKANVIRGVVLLSSLKRVVTPVVSKRAPLTVIVGLESPPCLIGMDIMRPLRVHIDVTNGTATPAQPDPQTIHLNAAQSHRPQKRPPHRQLAHLPYSRKTRRQEPLSQPPGQLYLPLFHPSDRKIRWPRTGVQLSPRRQIFLQPLLNPVQTRQTPVHHLAHPHTASCARLLQTADIPPETARLVPVSQPMAH